MKQWLQTQWKRLLVLPPIAVGVLVVLFLARNKRPLDRQPLQEAERTLSVVRIAKTDVIPRVVGYGTAQPREIWRAISEVRGKIIQIHKDLNSGGIIDKGEVLVQIDREELELQAAQLGGEVEQTQAQMKELDLKKKNYVTSRTIEKQALEASRSQFESAYQAYKNGAGAQNQVDKALADFAARQQSYQNILNSLILLPSQRKSLEATLKIKQAKLKQANLDLKKTKITAPFDCRLGDVNLRLGQYVSAGEQLFEAYNTDVAEIEVQIALDQGRRLLPPKQSTVQLSELQLHRNIKQLRKYLQIKASVEVRDGNFVRYWPAEFDRVRERVNPETRTVGVIVRVHEPFRGAKPGKRPPLLKGTYCTVELSGKPREGRVIIPRLALHEIDTVYVVDQESRLRKRKVDVEFAQQDFVVIKGGLKPDELVIASDPAPAIEGMLVDPKENMNLAARLQAQATEQGGYQ